MVSSDVDVDVDVSATSSSSSSSRGLLVNTLLTVALAIAVIRWWWRRRRRRAAGSAGAFAQSLKSKRSNSYYYAHGDRANDGITEFTMNGPRKLGKDDISTINYNSNAAAPSKITLCKIEKYKFADEDFKVTVYLPYERETEWCFTKDLLSADLENDALSFRLVIEGTHVLEIPKLFGRIDGCKIGKKAKRFSSGGKPHLVLTLNKSQPAAAWPTLADKGRDDVDD